MQGDFLKQMKIHTQKKKFMVCCREWGSSNDFKLHTLKLAQRCQGMYCDLVIADIGNGLLPHRYQAIT